MAPAQPRQRPHLFHTMSDTNVQNTSIERASRILVYRKLTRI